MSSKYLCFNDMQFTQFQSCTQVTTCPQQGCRCYPIRQCPLQMFTFGTCYSPINKCTGSYQLAKNLVTYKIGAQASEGETTSTLAIYTDLRVTSPSMRPTIFVNSTSNGGGSGGSNGLPIETNYIIYAAIGIGGAIFLCLFVFCCCVKNRNIAAGPSGKKIPERGNFELVNVGEEVNV